MTEASRAATLNSNVSDVTRLLMARDGIRTQKDLAVKLGVNAPWLSRRMDGSRAWQLEDVDALAEFFAVGVATFFESPQSLLRSRWFWADVDDAPGVAATHRELVGSGT